MSAFARWLAALLTVLGVALAGLLVGVGAASAESDPPAKCFRANRYGELPTCEWDGTRWTRHFDGTDEFDQMSGSSGPANGFAALVVLAGLGGIAFTVWRVSTSRRMARDAGMSTRDATAMTLLSDDGFEATYLASNLRGQRAPAAPTPAAPVAQRLRELADLRDQGLITPAEHDARRARILDAL